MPPLCVWRVWERFLFRRNGFKFLTDTDSKTSQFEIVVKSLARFNTRFKIKGSFTVIKVKNTWRLITEHFGNKNNYKIAGRTLEYDQLNWSITARIETEKYSKIVQLFPELRYEKSQWKLTLYSAYNSKSCSLSVITSLVAVSSFASLSVWPSASVASSLSKGLIQT